MQRSYVKLTEDINNFLSACNAFHDLDEEEKSDRDGKTALDTAEAFIDGIVERGSELRSGIWDLRRLYSHVAGEVGDIPHTNGHLTETDGESVVSDA
jgi:hypothetical protein